MVKVLILESTILFLLVTCKILLVSRILILDVTVLLDFVMVNIKSSSIEGQILSILYELSSIGGLVANESVWALTITSFENSDRFNFSEALEELFKRFFSFFGIKSFYIQITSLFWGFVFKAFMFNDLFTFFFLLGRDNIQLLTLVFLIV